MNKENFIKELATVTGLPINKCIVINSILESHFIIGKNNKIKIVSNIETQLQMTKEESEKIYESAMSIIGTNIKEKIKRPFKNLD